MKRDRVLTISFMDGTKISFDFPAQTANEAARSFLFDEILKNPYFLIEIEGAILMYPTVNIKSVQLSMLSGPPLKQGPKGLIRGARVVR